MGLLLLAFFLPLLLASPAPPNELVLGGTEVPVGKYPFFVRLEMVMNNGKKMLCGGSLLTDRHVLTLDCFSLRCRPQTRRVQGLHWNHQDR
ncbi:hypothetical protein L596_030426 [Steinernema carpocapsae]|uniref:Peptidase S1 domain-containing protein n=1 Tax=Steinernema carpocapsae TaxID=34508 RepID=A0A4U5LPD0_STECR|nr:hypothetical protein L596_030426 [Steinernema carpocapsae]